MKNPFKTPDDQAPPEYRKKAYDARQSPVTIMPLVFVLIAVGIVLGCVFK
jgi:hypothetical protein